MLVCTPDGSSRHSAPPVSRADNSERACRVHVHVLPSFAATRQEVPVFRADGDFTSTLNQNFLAGFLASCLRTRLTSGDVGLLSWSLTRMLLLTGTPCVPSNNSLTTRSLDSPAPLRLRSLSALAPCVPTVPAVFHSVEEFLCGGVLVVRGLAPVCLVCTWIFLLPKSPASFARVDSWYTWHPDADALSRKAR